MSHFAKIDSHNIITEVIVAEQDFINSGAVGDSFLWVQTSYNNNFRKQFGGIGYTYDKVNDVTLRLKWTDSELISFIAKRLFTALESEKLMNPETLIISTNLDGFGLKGLSILRFAPWIPYWIKKKILNLDNVNSERNSSFQETLSKAMVLKLFPREIKHLNEKGKVEEICFFKFLLSHFKDGHDIITPRNLLIFLKKVRDDANQYYIENNDQSVHVEKNKGNYEWSLFKKILVYRSYLEVKNSYMLNISKVDNDWTKYIVVFLQKRGNKTSFEYNWIKNITGLEDAGTESFIAYLCHIGFLKLTSHSANIKHRVYSVPIIYMPTEEASWSVS